MRNGSRDDDHVVPSILLLDPADDPGPRSRDARVVTTGLERWAHAPRWTQARRRATQLLPRPHSTLLAFSRLTDVPGGLLGETLDGWWQATSSDGVAGVDSRLVLLQPVCRGGQWSIQGSMRIHAPWRWLPVDMDLWPHLDCWTYLTMQPRFRTNPTRAYFRHGNRSVETFVASVRSCVPT